jgi:hypothetical protein
MCLRPLKHTRKRTTRRAALDDVQCPDVDQRFMLGIQGVKMWWRMILPKHLYNDSIERR